MRASKVFSFIFGILGTALMLLTVILSLTSLDGEVRMAETPTGAVACTEQFMKALAEGDYPAAEALMYGDNTLGAPREASSEEGKLVWNAYAKSFFYEFNGGCYGSGNGVCRDVTITTMDITSITEALQLRAEVILEKKKADAQEVNNMNLVYEEDGSVKETVMDNVIETAIAQALAEDVKTLTTTVTLELVNENGAWQVLPGRELLKAVSGGL